MHPKCLSIKDYTYFLPEEKIAKYPSEKRDSSKLLIYRKGKVTEDVYSNIADHLPENSLLIFNNTRVIEARILFQKLSGAVIEIFCLGPNDQYPDITTALSQQEKVLWKCMIGGASKWKHGQVLEKKIDQLILRAKYIEKKQDSFIIELSWSPKELSFAEVLHYAGSIPLPPYIKRDAEKSDAERYQTVYAHASGSVASPTAGLHFTEPIFEKLKKKNIHFDFVTLHVGAGTFKPVKTETMEDHEMLAEHFDVSKTTIQNILNNLDRAIIPVGTTALRTIESLYWMGVKSRESGVRRQESLVINQWEVYDNLKENISPKESLQALLESMEKKSLEKLISQTQIIIAPGYKVKIPKALLTNFHQPQSTLLLLVAALIGDNWKNVYSYALKNNFRFLSYGDGSLLWIG